MAYMNKFIAAGRLTRDPEAFASGKGVKFGICLNKRKKNQQTGQWEDAPIFIDCVAWNRGEQGTLANRIATTLHKGSSVLIEGEVQMEQWDDKNGGGKRTKLSVLVDNFQYLDPKQDGQQGGATPRQGQRPSRVHDQQYDDYGHPSTVADGDDLPF